MSKRTRPCGGRTNAENDLSLTGTGNLVGTFRRVLSDAIGWVFSQRRKPMAQTLFQFYFHIVFSTKNRCPFIRPELEEELFAYMGMYGTDMSLTGTELFYQPKSSGFTRRY